MTDFATIGLRSDTRGLLDAQRELRNLTSQGSRTENAVNNSMSKMDDGFRSVERAAKRLGGVIGAAFTVRALVNYADTWTDLQARVNLAIGEHENGVHVMGRLGEMARRTYSDLNGTVEAWLANSTALRELGMTTSESLDFQEAMNNALVVSGARADRAAQVNNALSQAMALGALRGHQLNTVIMNGGRVAELLAAELGVNVNQLRALGAQGAITGDVIQRALVGNLEKLREEADSMPATIGDALTLMGNSIQTLVGRFDQMLGASELVAGGIIFLADNLQLAASIAIAAGGAVALSYVPAVISATGATLGWVASLVTLRGALLATGIGALIVGAGVLIDFLIRLRQATGSWGEALEALGRLARIVWEGISTSAAAMVPALQAVWQDIKAGFFQMAAEIQWRWSELLGSIATGLRSIPFIGDDLADRVAATGRNAAAGWEEFEGAASSAANAADRLRNVASQMASAGVDRARSALDELNAILAQNTDGTTAAADAARELAAELDAIAGGGSGGSGGAAYAVKELADAVDEAAQRGQELESAFQSAFVGFVTGAQSARQAAAQLLQQLARLLANRAFQSLFAGAFSGGGFLSSFAGFFDQGGTIPRGQFGVVGEYGPELVRGPAHVTGREETARMMRGGESSGKLSISIGFDRSMGGFKAEVMDETGQMMAQGFQQYDRQALPARVAQISRDPRARGR